jgi:hypothetical protein
VIPVHDIVHYGVPLVAFGIGHLVGFLRHKHYGGQGIKDIVKGWLKQ